MTVCQSVFTIMFQILLPIRMTLLCLIEILKIKFVIRLVENWLIYVKHQVCGCVMAEVVIIRVDSLFFITLGQSVIDYMLIHKNFFDTVSFFKVLDPIEFTLQYGGWFVPIYDLSSFRFVAAKRRQNDNYHLFAPKRRQIDKTTKRKVDKMKAKTRQTQSAN
jgi:hypothetical protein